MTSKPANLIIMHRVCRTMRAGSTAFAAALFVIGLAQAQSTAGDGTAKPQMMAKDADPGWEVATVKPSDPSDNGSQRIHLRGRHVTLLNTTVEQFLLLGYGVQKVQVLRAPGWATTERWNVEGLAGVEGEPSLRQLQGMIQKILKERFGLVLHHEQREMTVYLLTETKGGSKMTVNASDPNGWMDQQNGGSDGQHIEILKNASMAELAQILQFHLDRPVVDQTGLKGRYDFKLQWTTDDTREPARDAPPGLFTAIQEQIGLKLAPAKAPADVLVIDTVEKPGEN
jgi:uncharacterized protein (TIGR03435 family)